MYGADRIAPGDDDPGLESAQLLGERRQALEISICEAHGKRIVHPFDQPCCCKPLRRAKTNPLVTSGVP